MNKNKIVKFLSMGILSTILVTSCNVKPSYEAKKEETKTRTVATNPTKTQNNSNANGSNANKPINTQSSSNANKSNASNMPLDLPLPAKDSVSGKALDKYVEALKGTKSDVTTLNWNIEEGTNKTAGSVVLQTLYEEGAPTLIKGNDKTFANANPETVASEVDWYKSLDKVIIYEEGGYKEYKLNDLEHFGNFEISALITRALSFAEATEDEKDYVVVVETSDKNFIKELMGYLSYTREDEKAWDADLTMEITIDKTNGHLKAINYVATNKETKKKDSGEIIISGYNEVNDIKLPDNIGQPSQAPTQAPNAETTKPQAEEAVPAQTEAEAQTEAAAQEEEVPAQTEAPAEQ